MHSCIGICYVKLYEAAKIHVQIMRCTCCSNMTFSLTKPIWPWFVCMTLHRKALPPWLIISPMLLFPKTLRASMTVWRCYDVRKFETDAILFREIQCKKRDILMFKRCFQCGLGWNQVKYARITITHVCFIALTLAGALGRCLNTRPNSLMFKQLPLDPANVNAWKNMCDPYNISQLMRLLNMQEAKGQTSLSSEPSLLSYTLQTSMYFVNKIIAV